ncbi:hypothetical protein [Pseudoduganella violacea]|uniref:Lipoprotein n=1 Tax=Pseudoduganella violacea TaxID=1715466 RepID=A0A7W5FSM4_9BURK|nr:hypothetical protein [Pseudoduganella violacea]MBB3117934.1 hypothetical protein [Pseudoduganella violacea]
MKMVTLYCLICFIAGCGSTAGRTSKTYAQLWEETVRQADTLLSIQREFEKTHHFNGEITQTAVRQLSGEGFECSLKYKMLPTLAKGSIDRFTVENVPMIYCSKLHIRQGPDDTCRTFWAAFEVNWQEPTLPPEVLETQFVSSTIKKEMYFCRSTDHG